MDRSPVQSSTIKKIGYDPETQRLAVEFHSGRVYVYERVEPEKYKELLAAPSIGRHFGTHIKPNHACALQKD